MAAGNGNAGAPPEASLGGEAVELHEHCGASVDYCDAAAESVHARRRHRVLRCEAEWRGDARDASGEDACWRFRDTDADWGNANRPKHANAVAVHTKSVATHGRNENMHANIRQM